MRDFRFQASDFRFLLILFLGWCAPAWAAVDDYLGKPIGAVRITIDNREANEAALTQVIETMPGQPLSMAAVRESITHLFSLGRFESVSVDATMENGRVALRYDLRPIHLVARIRFARMPPGIDEHALRRAIADRFGVAPAYGRAGDIARLVEATLRERGYVHATVTPETQADRAADRASLTFTIDPHDRVTVGTVDIVGRPTISAPEFLKRLGLTRGAPYEPGRLTANIEKYLVERRSRGYYEARVVPAVSLADDDRVANVTLTINPGPHVRVVFAGDPLPSDRRDELVPIAREGSADEDLLEDSSHRIEEYFHAQGYREAAAPHTREEANGELVITFTIAKGALHRVAAYEISGNQSVPLQEFAPALRVHVGEPFVDSRLDADSQTVETLYHRRGFATARAPTAAEPQPPGPSGQVPVNVRMVITEGSRTTIEAVTFSGNTALDDAKLRARVGLKAGEPYIPGQLALDRDAIQLAYQDLGYQNVIVDAPAPQFSADQSRATVNFRIQEGPRIFIDHVLVVGNVRTRTETIERELQIKAGDAYSPAAVNESQRRLAALGLFRRARITEVRHGNDATRDLLVTVEEAPPTTIGVGGGLEGKRLADTRGAGGVATERFDIAPRALFEIGRRNLFGRTRSANLFTSVSRSVTQPGESNPLIEYRVVATFREPHLFDTPADAFINGTLEQQHRSTFDFARRSLSANVERRFSGPYRITGTYQLQRTRVFNLKLSEQAPLIDKLFPQFRLSSFAGSLIRDTRDDPLDTHDGHYASATGQLAGEAIGSEVGFVKSFFTAQMFRTIPRTRQMVFAGNARLGMATAFTRLGTPGAATEGQLPASERFFAGGDTTVRGFALDQLGVRHFPAQPHDTVDQDGFAIGGNGLVLFNAELRVPVTGGFGVVGFVDTGNVFARPVDIDLGELRSAVGGGIRYRSPVGPLRIDLGMKVNRQPGESRLEWFVSFGQAF